MTPSIQVKVKCDTWRADGERCATTAMVEVELSEEYVEGYRTGRYLIGFEAHCLPEGWTTRFGSALCPEHGRG